MSVLASIACLAKAPMLNLGMAKIYLFRYFPEFCAGRVDGEAAKLTAGTEAGKSSETRRFNKWTLENELYLR